MEKILVMLNHNLTPEQVDELAAKGFTPEYLDASEKAIWADVDPAATYEQVSGILANHPECTNAIVQGAFWAVAQTQAIMGLDKCWFAYSKRNSGPDKINADGSTTKTVVFKHIGFINFGTVVK